VVSEHGDDGDLDRGGDLFNEDRRLLR
jgi:hypothetical protein